MVIVWHPESFSLVPSICIPYVYPASLKKVHFNVPRKSIDSAEPALYWNGAVVITRDVPSDEQCRGHANDQEHELANSISLFTHGNLLPAEIVEWCETTAHRTHRMAQESIINPGLEYYPYCGDVEEENEYAHYDKKHCSPEWRGRRVPGSTTFTDSIIGEGNNSLRPYSLKINPIAFGTLSAYRGLRNGAGCAGEHFAEPETGGHGNLLAEQAGLRL
jgi:hypothetical protein